MNIDWSQKKLMVSTLPPFVQGENRAHTEIIEFPPVCAGYDLSDFTFVLRGICPDESAVAEAVLEKEVTAQGVLLFWPVTYDFTAYGGRLDLELRVFGPDPDRPVLKFTGDGPVFVRRSEDDAETIPPEVAQDVLHRVQASAGAAADHARMAGAAAQESAQSAARADLFCEQTQSEKETVSALRQETLRLRDETERIKAETEITVLVDEDADSGIRVGFQRAGQDAPIYTPPLQACVHAGTVTMLPPDAVAAITQTGPPQDRTISFALPRGETGEQGKTGERGEIGERGETGSQGPAGKSAYQFAQEGGYAGPPESFAAELTSISEKSDKVKKTGISGHFAALDAQGNITDSGWYANMFPRKPTAVVKDNLSRLTIGGDLADSGESVASLTGGARCLVPCTCTYDEAASTFRLLRQYPAQTTGSVFTVRFIPCRDYLAGAPLFLDGTRYGAAYANTEGRVADGAFRQGKCVMLALQSGENPIAVFPGGVNATAAGRSAFSSRTALTPQDGWTGEIFYTVLGGFIILCGSVESLNPVTANSTICLLPQSVPAARAYITHDAGGNHYVLRCAGNILSFHGAQVPIQAGERIELQMTLPVTENE